MTRELCILTLNVQGLRDKSKRTRLYEWIKNQKGVYRVSIVKRPLLSTLPFLLAFYDSVSPACRKRRLKGRRDIAIVADTA